MLSGKHTLTCIIVVAIAVVLFLQYTPNPVEPILIEHKPQGPEKQQTPTPQTTPSPPSTPNPPEQQPEDPPEQKPPEKTIIPEPEPEERTKQILFIEKKLETKNKVKVIIQVNENTDIQAFIEKYNLDQDTLKEFERIPFIAIEIDLEDLDSLKESTEMQGLQEDMLFKPLLTQSVPLIGADNVSDNLGYNGSGITVVVLDTGVNKSHAAFGSRVVDEACYSTHNPGSNVYSLCPGSVEQTTANNSGLDCAQDIDGCGHGTHVAGIVAANSTNGNGVAPGANIISIQVFSEFTASGDCSPDPAPCVRAYFSDILLGLQRAYALRNTYTIGAVSMSIGGGQYTSNCDGSFSSMKTAIDDLKTADIPTVIASGNDGYTNAMGAPACISTAVSVGATTKADAVASYSNSASFLTLLATGSSIYAANYASSTGYTYKSGTSMATPHVSGAFAVLRQKYPSKTVDEMITAFEHTGTNLTKSSVTKPRINVDLAYQFLSGVTYTNFNGNTTDFTSESNLSNVCSVTVEITGNGRIDFGGCVDADGANLDNHISISGNTISVNSSVLSSWNQSATLTFYDLNLTDPVIVDDETNLICTHCTLVSNTGGDVTITVDHFSSYTVVENTSLFLIDATDTIEKVTGQNVLFQANYSYTNSTPISDGTCQISFDTQNGYEHATLSYNATSTEYEYARNFTAGGTYNWNVTCTHSSNPTIAGTDQYTITEYGTLRAAFESHEYGVLHRVNQDLTFTSGALLYCDGNGTATCGNITAYHRDNRTGVFAQTSTSAASTPLFTTSSQPQYCVLVTGSPCYFNWTINASGSAGEQFLIQINYSSNQSQVSSLTGTTKTMEINSDNNANLTQVHATNATIGDTGIHSMSSNLILSDTGNVTRVVISSNQTTLKWQGLYGNISDGLILGDGANTFFEFTDIDPFAVIATQSITFDWSNVTAASAADVDTHWNFNIPADVDQAVDTFTKYKFFGDIKDVPYATLHELFYSGVVQDGPPASKNDFGFIAAVNMTGATGFKDGTYNYELIVPVESGTESYYLYLALE